MKLYKRTTASRLTAPQPAILDYPEVHPATIEDIRKAAEAMGYVVVPEEPSDKQLTWGEMRVLDMNRSQKLRTVEEHANIVYKAMIAAAKGEG